MNILVQCKTCNENVAIGAHSCPKCGENDPSLYNSLWSVANSASYKFRESFVEWNFLLFKLSGFFVVIIVFALLLGKEVIGLHSSIGYIIFAVFFISCALFIYMYKSDIEMKNQISYILIQIKRDIVKDGITDDIESIYERNKEEYRSFPWNE